jgi:hypothetical protein
MPALPATKPAGKMRKLPATKAVGRMTAITAMRAMGKMLPLQEGARAAVRVLALAACLRQLS